MESRTYLNTYNDTWLPVDLISIWNLNYPYKSVSTGCTKTQRKQKNWFSTDMWMLKIGYNCSNIHTWYSTPRRHPVSLWSTWYQNVLGTTILAKSPAFSGTLPGFRLISSTTPDLPHPSRDSVYLVVPAKTARNVSKFHKSVQFSHWVQST